MPMVSVTALPSIFGCAAKALVGLCLQPQLGQAGLAAAERDRAAHLRPLPARRGFDEGIVAQSRVQSARSGWLIVGSSMGRISPPRLILMPARLALVLPKWMLPVRCGSSPPVRQELRARGHQHIAAEIRGLVEGLVGERLDLLAETPPSSPPMAPPMPPTVLPAVLPSEPVMWMVPVSGVLTVSASLAPVTDIEPRDTLRPISALSSSWMIGLSFLPVNSCGAEAVEPVADGAERDGDRRHHRRGARDRLAAAGAPAAWRAKAAAVSGRKGRAPKSRRRRRRPTPAAAERPARKPRERPNRRIGAVA